MSLDTTIPPLALKLITKYGTTISLVTSAKAAYNSSTASATITKTTQSLKGLVEEYADNLRFLGDKTNLPNSLIEGDKKISIAASGLTVIPKVSDKVIVKNNTFNIMGIGSLWSGELVAVYVLHCRRT